MRPSRSSALLLAALVSLAAAAAHADLLVTRDGATIETLGPWRVEGRSVLFTLPNGTLSSIRTDVVDLDRSAVVTASARAAAAAPEPYALSTPEPAEPVWTITDKDFEPPPAAEGDEADPAEGESEEAGEFDDLDFEAADDGDGTGAAGGSDGPLEVISWDQLDMPTGDGLEVFGTVRNNSAEALVSPGMTVLVYGERGGLLATADGSVNQPSIAPGQTANFRAALPGITDFAAIRFNLAGRAYDVRSATSESAQADADAEPVPEEEIDPDPGAQYDHLLEEDDYGDEEPSDDPYEEPPFEEEPPVA
jgi:hypothetical protein